MAVLIDVLYKMQIIVYVLFCFVCGWFLIVVLFEQNINRK